MENFDKEFDKKLNEKYEKLSEDKRNELYLKQKKVLTIISIIVPIILIVDAIIMLIVMGQENDAELFGMSIFFGIILLIFAIITPIWCYKTLKDKEKTIKMSLKREVKQTIKKELEEDKFREEFGDFKIDKDIFVYSVTQLSRVRLLIDIDNKKFVFVFGKKYSKVYDFKNIINYEIYEDGNSVVKGSAGRALIGGAFFGVTGALIGSSGKRKISNYCQSLKLLVRINDIEQPLLEIPFINTKTQKDGITYKNCLNSLQQICAYFEYMINNKTIEESAKTLNDSVEERRNTQTKSKKEKLTELKELFEDGLITEEDFNNKKQDILDSEQ